MKKKLTALILFLFVINITVFAELLVDKGFIEELGWTYKNGGAVLNGKRFYSVADSYREQKGYIRGKLGMEIPVWLYDTYTYHNGDGYDILHEYLPEFFESYNYYMVWEKEISEGATDEMKSLMKRKNCDIAIYLTLGLWFVVSFDKQNNTYTSRMFNAYPY